jgi:hypothetical protein
MVRLYRLFCIFLLVPTLAGQVGSQKNKAAWDAFYAEQAKLRQRGKDALEREQARSKAHLCDHSGEGDRGGAGIADCLGTEVKTTEHDYLTYVQAIGALLRLHIPDDSDQKAPKRLLFDSAEESWQRYRDQACPSMATQWVDVTSPIANLDCHLQLTWNHMNELDLLYSDLWH